MANNPWPPGLNPPSLLPLHTAFPSRHSTLPRTPCSAAGPTHLPQHHGLQKRGAEGADTQGPHALPTPRRSRSALVCMSCTGLSLSAVALPTCRSSPLRVLLHRPQYAYPYPSLPNHPCLSMPSCFLTSPVSSTHPTAHPSGAWPCLPTCSPSLPSRHHYQPPLCPSQRSDAIAMPLESAGKLSHGKKSWRGCTSKRGWGPGLPLSSASSKAADLPHSHHA